MNRKQYFGTDGIRGRVGGGLINPQFVMNLGWAAGRVMSSQDCAQVVIGKDTRVSGYMLESALKAGFSAAGVDVLLAGSVPTPAVAYLTRILHACAGIVISASHNHHHDNGIKFFDAYGHKLSDQTELAIEAMLGQPVQTEDSENLGKEYHLDNADARYIAFCKSSIPFELSLKGLRVIVDCANGAAHRVAPRIFSELGAEVLTMGIEPDGVNINLNCGATNLQALQKEVVARSADLGIALDGDADRVMMIDSDGNVLDGDRLIYIIARDRIKAGSISGPVVGTLMSNLGLEKAISALGLDFIRERVGDRFVMHRLHQDNGILGGEPSGHVICLDKTTTGDGIIAALQVLKAMVEENLALSELVDDMMVYPQVLINIRVQKILKPEDLSAAEKYMRQAEKALNGNARILLRPSGTEPLIRVMVEGDNSERIQAVAQKLADQIAASFTDCLSA